MRYSRWNAGVPLMLFCVLAMQLVLAGTVAAESKSSCVTCHLDEDKIIDSLAVVKGKSSAMQSGAG